MFVSICFRGDCIGWAYLDAQSRCLGDTNNKWIYHGGAHWEYAHDGLSVRCIGEEGENARHDAKISIVLSASIRGT